MTSGLFVCSVIGYHVSCSFLKKIGIAVESTSVLCCACWILGEIRFFQREEWLHLPWKQDTFPSLTQEKQDSTTTTGRLLRKEKTQHFEAMGKLFLRSKKRQRTFCCNPESSWKAVKRRKVLQDLPTTIRLDRDIFVYKPFYFHKWQPWNKTQTKELVVPVSGQIKPRPFNC